MEPPCECPDAFLVHISPPLPNSTCGTAFDGNHFAFCSVFVHHAVHVQQRGPTEWRLSDLANLAVSPRPGALGNLDAQDLDQLGSFTACYSTRRPLPNCQHGDVVALNFPCGSDVHPTKPRLPFAASGLSTTCLLVTDGSAGDTLGSSRDCWTRSDRCLSAGCGKLEVGDVAPTAAVGLSVTRICNTKPQRVQATRKSGQPAPKATFAEIAGGRQKGQSATRQAVFARSAQPTWEREQCTTTPTPWLS